MPVNERSAVEQAVYDLINAVEDHMDAQIPVWLAVPLLRLRELVNREGWPEG